MSRRIDPTEILADVATYADLLAALKARRRAIGMSQVVADDEAGLPGGYTAKLECGKKRLGEMSLESLLGALSLRLVLVPAAAKHPKSRASASAYHAKPKNFHSAIGKKGGVARSSALTKKRRLAIARAGAQARWKAERERKMQSKGV